MKIMCTLLEFFICNLCFLITVQKSDCLFFIKNIETTKIAIFERAESLLYKENILYVDFWLKCLNLDFLYSVVQ